MKKEEFYRAIERYRFYERLKRLYSIFASFFLLISLIFPIFLITFAVILAFIHIFKQEQSKIKRKLFKGV